MCRQLLFKSGHKKLKSAYKKLKSAYKKLKSAHKKLKSAYKKLKSAYKRTEKCLQEPCFSPQRRTIVLNKLITVFSIKTRSFWRAPLKHVLEKTNRGDMTRFINSYTFLTNICKTPNRFTIWVDLQNTVK